MSCIYFRSMNSRVQQKNSEGIHDSPADFDVEGQLTTKVCKTPPSLIKTSEKHKIIILKD